MLYLFIVSLVWAFSFGLIKGNLAGVDSNFVSAARMLISLIIFLPLIRLRGLNNRLKLRLFVAGVLQFGIMYITYIYAFRFLKAYEVALFTVFTPLYVTLINNALQKRVRWLNIITTIMAVAGTAIVSLKGLPQGDIVQGFLLVQISNLCFAFGQVYYKESMRQAPSGVSDQQVFGLLYLGGFAVTLLAAGIFTDWQSLTLTRIHILTLLYLGAIASGVCFFLWNIGGRKVDTGTLAIFNDLKVPLAVTVSLLFFKEQANLINLLIGGAIVLWALYLNERGVRRFAVQPA
ncbi:MAG: EamA family transporter [Anaerolineae bacterium]|nr:EamA family transporter [Anaerolineae bacterium]